MAGKVRSKRPSKPAKPVTGVLTTAGGDDSAPADAFAQERRAWMHKKTEPFDERSVKLDKRYLGLIAELKHLKKFLPGTKSAFVTAALNNPLWLRRWEREFVEFATFWEGDWKKLAIAFVEIHSIVEHARYPRHPRKHPATYEEVSDPEFLFGGDYVPGASFELGNEGSFKREKLYIDRLDTELREFLIWCRIHAFKEKSEMALAQKIVDKVKVSFVYAEDHYESGMTMPVGDFLGDGKGVCRHQATIIQLGFQEVGIRSHMTRGNVGGGRHMWVEAVIDGVLYLFDTVLKGDLNMTGPVTDVTDRIYRHNKETVLRIWRRL